MAPYLYSTLFILALVILCFLRPNAGRIALGFLFLAAALVVNGFFISTNPQGYDAYLREAYLPLYRELTARTVAVHPVFYGLLLMAFEIAMGLLLLNKGVYVKIGLVGTMIFLIALAPVHTIQLPWLGLLIGQIYLLTKDFDRTFLEMVRRKR